MNKEFLNELGYYNIADFYLKNLTSKIFFYGKNKLIKVSQVNPLKKGLSNEFNILKKIHNLAISPKVYFYQKLDNIEILILERIEGKTLSEFNYFHDFDNNFKNILFLLYSNKIQHGDIKKDNIIINNNKQIFLIDFDQAFLLDKDMDFNFCPDIIGNIYSENLQMNFTNLLKETNTWKNKI